MANTLASTGTTTAVSTYTPSLSNINGQITTTSLQVAEHFGKRHADVIRAIRKLECSQDFAERNFALTTIETKISGASNSAGSVRKDPAYHITRKGFSFLAMGFTGKEAAQWKEAYLETFDRMEAALTQPSLPSTITPAQAQHLRELVQLVVESGKQGHGETWNRLHRKMKVNSYLMLSPNQFDEAVQYLRGKMDDTSTKALIQKHFPESVQLLPMPSLLNRRWMISYDRHGNELVQAIPMDAGIISPTLPADVHAFVNEMVPLGLMPKIIESANIRMGRYITSLSSNAS